MGPMVERAQIIVTGIVQGVGFRPFVFNLATSLHLSGFVSNTGNGVLIDAEGDNLAAFLGRLRVDAPPLARITGISTTSLPPAGWSGFTIRESTENSTERPFTLVSPDIATCRDCTQELMDPADRRSLYPFINCTNCGPRYTIIRHTPYDRPNTTMAGFTMCPACQAEYDDPVNRRFHAQPNACAQCGPRVEYTARSTEYKVSDMDMPIQKAIQVMKQGGIVAIKGIGGFHIACDARSDDAVRMLRERKRKSNKPFAVMAPDVQATRRFCVVTTAEETMLCSGRRPIVLLRKGDVHRLSGQVSPGNAFIGCMLPYTPLHQLLFWHPLGAGQIPAMPHFSALVMTSGNLAEEPIMHTNDEAVDRLGSIVDGFLHHDRDIFMRVDDSVVRVTSDMRKGTTNAPYPSSLAFIRRSRGFAPDPILLHDTGPEVLGCGADLKNTFTLTKGACAIPSQHIGDMENYETLTFYEECLENLRSVYRVDPAAIAHDLHPGYLSTKWALDQGARVLGKGSGMDRIVGIQHHYAHIGSVMAEQGWRTKVIGVALDGTGYGTDGSLWGGEFLLADVQGFERIAHFAYIPVPGGEAAIREPWRTAVGLMHRHLPERTADILKKIGFEERYTAQLLDQIRKISTSAELSPWSSGAGRLFEAVSALLGVCPVNTFEGEAAMMLESLVEPDVQEEYAVERKRDGAMVDIDFGCTVRQIVDDMLSGVRQGRIAARFHNTIASAVTSMVLEISRMRGVQDVALSGGTFQNQYLLERVQRSLEEYGLNVHTNHAVPCNDGGISLGQAYIVRERLKLQGA